MEVRTCVYMRVFRRGEIGEWREAGDWTAESESGGECKWTAGGP